MISFTKTIILLCFCTNILGELLKKTGMTKYTSIANNVLFITIVSLIIGVLLCKSYHSYILKFKKITTILILEDIFFITILSIFIINNGVSETCIKFLYIFSIVSITIAFGKKHGIIFAFLSSLIVFFIDLYLTSCLTINTYFENNLMLLAFVMVACILGEYKKVEEDQNSGLESELQEQLQQFNKIDYILLKNMDSVNLLLKYSYVAIVIHLNGKILYLNKKALNLLGIDSHNQAEDKYILDFVEVKNKEYLKNIYSSILEEQKTNISFKENILSNGGKKIMIQNISTYFTYGKTPSILTIMRDISPELQVKNLKAEVKIKSKLLNESKEQNKFITELFSNISHEFKTPLNIIFSSIHMLNTYNDNHELEFIEKRKNYLSIMKQNSFRLIRLINNILDITKYDSGFLTLQLKNADIVFTIENIVMSIVPYAETKEINIIFDTDIEEKIIAFDEDKMERIILNLLSNALKFTDNGGSIYVDIVDKNKVVEISVRDTGVGISEDKLSSIFDRFSQIDNTLNRNKEGTGIGLSLVKSFTNLHKGKVELKSKLGHGSEFIISIPVKKICDESDIKEIKNDITDRISMELSDIYSDQ